MNASNRIGIIFPFPYLDTVPSICNTAMLLARSGYIVDIFTYKSLEFNVPEFHEDNINVHIIQTEIRLKDIRKYKEFYTHQYSYYYRTLRAFFNIAKAVYIKSNNFLRRLRLIILSLNIESKKPYRYRYIIGVDPIGLLDADFLSKFVRASMIYYSLELLLSEEITQTELMRTKRQEIISSHKAAFVIIQDKERANLLAKDNKIPLEKFILVPNSPLGISRKKRSYYWNDLFGIPYDKKIVIHSGSLEDWTGIDQIIESVINWPEDWVLIVHTRYKASLRGEIDQLQKIAPVGRIFFSLNPVPNKEYDTLIDGADLGIAFYVPMPESTYTQQNIISIGFSSGKISYYLHSGLPIIVNETSSISELVKLEKCGISVKDISEIGEALTLISNDYDEFSKNALNFFKKYLDFEHSFQEVIRKIDNL